MNTDSLEGQVLLQYLILFYFVRKEGEMKQAFITQQVEVQVWNDFTYIHIK